LILFPGAVPGFLNEAGKPVEIGMRLVEMVYVGTIPDKRFESVKRNKSGHSPNSRQRSRQGVCSDVGREEVVG
jgi:hypothetical protein